MYCIQVDNASLSLSFLTGNITEKVKDPSNGLTDLSADSSALHQKVLDLRTYVLSDNITTSINKLQVASGLWVSLFLLSTSSNFH